MDGSIVCPTMLYVCIATVVTCLTEREPQDGRGQRMYVHTCWRVFELAVEPLIRIVRMFVEC